MTIYQENLKRAHVALVNAKASLSACAHDSTATDREREMADRYHAVVQVLQGAMADNA